MEGHDDVEGEGEIIFRRSRMLTEFFYVWAVDIYMCFPIQLSVSISWFSGSWSFPEYVGPFFFLSAAKELFINQMFRAEVQLLFLGLS